MQCSLAQCLSTGDGQRCISIRNLLSQRCTFFRDFFAFNFFNSFIFYESTTLSRHP